MTARTMTTARPVSVPTLALISAAAAAIGIIDGTLSMAIPALAYGGPPLWWNSTLLAMMHLGQVAAAIAVSRAGLAGSRVTARTGLVLWILGGLGFAVGELAYLAAGRASDIVFQIASTATLVGMVIAGVGVLHAGQWTGPGRFLPLITGLSLIPLTVVIIATDAALAALTGYSVLWLLLSLSLYSVTRAPQPAQAHQRARA
jgi:hypothetical protein